jgi:Fe-S cluster assembly scaffold protein SufB
MYLKKRYRPCHIPSEVVYTVRQEHVKLVYTMVYNTLTTVYTMVYTQTLVYTMVYSMRQQQVQFPDK